MLEVLFPILFFAIIMAIRMLPDYIMERNERMHRENPFLDLMTELRLDGDVRGLISPRHIFAGSLDGHDLAVALRGEQLRLRVWLCFDWDHPRALRSTKAEASTFTQAFARCPDPDEDLATLLAAPDVQSTLLDLRQRFDKVQITDGYLHLDKTFERGALDPSRLRQTLRHLEASLPCLTASQPQEPPAEASLQPADVVQEVALPTDHW